MEELPPGLSPVERARCQHLVFGVVRHAGRLEAALGRLIAHPPRFVTRAVLYVAGFELIEGTSRDSAASPAEGLAAKIVHHAVEQAKTLASPSEARLVNAVVRKLATALAEQTAPGRLASAEILADYYSHPLWLVRRWLAAHGAESTRALLEWNQRPAPVYGRVRRQASTLEVREPGFKPEEPAPWLKPTPWAGFYEIPSGHRADLEPLLKSGGVYLQDPATRLAVGLLSPRPGESVLDLCAAPGGKSLLIADQMGEGSLVAWDLPTAPLDWLRENLAKVTGVKTTLLTSDILRDAARMLRDAELPAEFPAVLIDVPCSNTGVMRHRVDVKWRMQEGDFHRHARQQKALLLAAAQLVAPGGRLVYSTCSIDPEENEQVAAAFLAGVGDRFKLEAQEISYPWASGHDGAAAFLFRKGSRADT